MYFINGHLCVLIREKNKHDMYEQYKDLSNLSGLAGLPFCVAKTLMLDITCKSFYQFFFFSISTMLTSIINFYCFTSRLVTFPLVLGHMVSAAPPPPPHPPPQKKTKTKQPCCLCFLILSLTDQDKILSGVEAISVDYSDATLEWEFVNEGK